MNAPEKDLAIDISLNDPVDVRRWRDPNKMVKLSLTIPETDVPKLYAFMQSDIYEKAEATRKADLAEGTKSLEHIVNYASREFGSGATVFAQFLASLYNGDRVKADVSGLRLLDGNNFEHMMNVLRLCFKTNREPHDFFKNGNDVFEYIIKRHGLEKRRRKS